MVNLILVRHGETEWNNQEIFRGRADVELNETGLRQADLLGRYLAGQPVSAVYSSPLQRALATAERIARPHSLEVKITPQLIDLDYGEWQGLAQEAVKENYPTLYGQWLAHPESVKMPGGEGLAAVRNRVARLADAIAAREEGAVVLVSHRVVLKVLVCLLLGLNNSRFWHIKIDNAGITTFAQEAGRFVLIGHNNTCFLETLARPPLADF